MKTLLYKLFLIILIIVTMLSFIAYRFNTGYFDQIYVRLNTPKAASMIIGTSRAAQGVRPKILESILSTSGLESPILNFSFTLFHTPYGEKYLNLIETKIDKNTRNGLFLLTVDPWAVSILSDSETDKDKFRENKTFVADLSSSSINPNFEYLLKHAQTPFYNSLNIYPDTTMQLHKNGWLEVNVKVDSANLAHIINGKMSIYQDYAAQGHISAIRVQELEKIIKFLKNYGKVFLVRLPVSKDMAEIESEYAPNFNDLINAIAVSNDIDYLDYIDISDNYLTIDGNHLSEQASDSISKLLAFDIKCRLEHAGFSEEKVIK